MRSAITAAKLLRVGMKKTQQSLDNIHGEKLKLAQSQINEVRCAGGQAPAYPATLAGIK